MTYKKKHHQHHHTIILLVSVYVIIIYTLVHAARNTLHAIILYARGEWLAMAG